ncbi:MAG: hypothetical protein GWO24_07580, partial [Akkermansiaceae bacterium]|nr:hypothetical protein [Akkermansiaceae bacterium]
LIATCQGCGDRMHETLVEADGFEHLALTCRSCDRVAYELPVSMYEAFIAKIASEVEHRARSIDP